jgi:hypothetical protein
MAELIIQNWLSIDLKFWLGWTPNSIIMKPWTLVSHFFVQGRSPLGFLFELIALYFFLPPTQLAYGKKGLQRLFTLVVLSTVVFGLIGTLLTAVSSTSPQAMGMGPFITSLVVIFGLRNPNASIYLIVFPVKAAWIAWGSGLLSVLSFLGDRSLPSLLWIAGWVAGYLFIQMNGKVSFKKMWRQYKHKQRYNRLKAHDGGRSDKWEH